MSSKKKLRRTFYLTIVFALAVIGLYGSQFLGIDIGFTGNIIKNIGSEQSNKNSVEIIVENPEQEIITLFCPRDDCAQNFEFMINSSEKIKCALFDIDVHFLIKALENKNAFLVVDNNNYDVSLSFARKDTSSQLSHNKFCVFDDKIVWTGSYNPTDRGSYKNNNNVIVFFSETLAKNYNEEFNELWEGQFGKGNLVKNPKVLLNDVLVENYFCPEDWCANKVLRALSLANESIYFMTFSFTHKEIADLIVEKHNSGVEVKGIMEKSQNSKYSKHDFLVNAGIDVKWDANKYNMHHKVFIIDEKIVVTGSFNPTNNADTNNDENVVIVYNEEIARRYLKEFNSLYLMIQ